MFDGVAALVLLPVVNKQQQQPQPKSARTPATHTHVYNHVSPGDMCNRPVRIGVRGASVVAAVAAAVAFAFRPNVRSFGARAK